MTGTPGHHYYCMPVMSPPRTMLVPSHPFMGRFAGKTLDVDSVDSESGVVTLKGGVLCISRGSRTMWAIPAWGTSRHHTVCRLDDGTYQDVSSVLSEMLLAARQQPGLASKVMRIICDYVDWEGNPTSDDMCTTHGLGRSLAACVPMLIGDDDDNNWDFKAAFCEKLLDFAACVSARDYLVKDSFVLDTGVDEMGLGSAVREAMKTLEKEQPPHLTRMALMAAEYANDVPLGAKIFAKASAEALASLFQNRERSALFLAECIKDSSKMLEQERREVAALQQVAVLKVAFASQMA